VAAGRCRFQDMEVSGPSSSVRTLDLRGVVCVMWCGVVYVMLFWCGVVWCSAAV
jgi:hypothetical protein